MSRAKSPFRLLLFLAAVSLALFILAAFLHNIASAATSLEEAPDDEPPSILEAYPSPGAAGLPLTTTYSITFSEPVTVSPDAVRLDCLRSGPISPTLGGGPVIYTVTPTVVPVFGETCILAISAGGVRDHDGLDPPDEPAADWQAAYTMLPADFLVINELDAIMPLYRAQFVELYDGGRGNTNLDGLALALFSGHDGRVYKSFDLGGHHTDEQGYLLLASRYFPAADIFIDDALLQSGNDAVALYAAPAHSLPVGTAVTTTNLLDALVYGRPASINPALLALLLPGEVPADEDDSDLADFLSLQRCPNGSGDRRRTSSYALFLPTPKAVNHCNNDLAPQVIGTTPSAGARDVDVTAGMTITFSEPVSLDTGGIQLVCSRSGTHDLALTLAETAVKVTPRTLLGYSETCELTVHAAGVHDLDEADPPDTPVEDTVLSFHTLPAMHLLINELDSDTPGIDTAEFIELYDGGAGGTPLDGLALVFFNGRDALSYKTIDLTGYLTDEHGYFVIGSEIVASAGLAIAAGSLQNGPDAVALFAAPASSFPSGTAATTNNLLDAVVYGEATNESAGLLSLLLPGEEIVYEGSRGAREQHALQRCPNGSGEQRRTGTFLANTPTPGVVNFCLIDAAPAVTGHTPAAGASAIDRNVVITASFSEAVAIAADGVLMQCETSGSHPLTASGGPLTFTFRALTPAVYGERCSVRVVAGAVTDKDLLDPPDHLQNDIAWSFTITVPPLARHMVINELDSDTAGIDTAEFIELYDGGAGNTALDGLQLVLVNGRDGTSYRRIDLAGYRTNKDGYLLIGASSVAGDGVNLPAGTIQNGPDAAALFVKADYEENERGQPQSDGLLDAVVYHTDDDPGTNLLYLLLDDEQALNEGQWRDATVDSNQRCGGSQRQSGGFLQNLPTPGAANNCIPDMPPRIVAVGPQDGSIDVPLDSTLAVDFDEPVSVQDGWITMHCENAGAVTLTTKGGPQAYTIAAALPAYDSCLAAIHANLVSDLDGYPDPPAESVAWRFSTGKPLFGACGDPALPLHEIQGSGSTSPLSGTMGVVVEGIVTGNFQETGAPEGFFLQAPPEREDGDPRTAEALFVAGGDSQLQVEEGDLLRLQGTVTEWDGMTSLVPVDQWQLCEHAQNIEPLAVELPVGENHDWEALEGMLLTFAQSLVISGSDSWGSSGILELAAERLFAPTELAPPGETAQQIAMQNERQRLTLDDGRHGTPSVPEAAPRLGDMIAGITGVLQNSGGAYRLQPVLPFAIQQKNPRPELPPLLPGRVRVSLINSGGFLNGDGHGSGFLPGQGAASPAEYARQKEKLAAAISASEATIIGLTEVENDGSGSGSAIQDLLTGVNSKMPHGQQFAAIVLGPSMASPIESRAVFLYREDLVAPLNDPLGSSTPPFATQVPPPLGQTFKVWTTGEELTIVVSQFPRRDNCAKGAPEEDSGCNDELRRLAALALANWVQDLLGQINGELLLLGDLNSFALEEPPGILSATGLQRLAGEPGAYNAVQDSEAGNLSYAFCTSGLLPRVAMAQNWHVNADEPAALDYRLTNPPALFAPNLHRFAARDPLIIDLAPQPLSAGFYSDSPVAIGQAVHFHNSSHGPQPLALSWDFGDGSPPVTETDPVHVYAQTGTYEVKLTVRTSWGETSMYSAPVEVQPTRVYLPILR
ncbi:MAG: ExeM/NucH family extracellular endonuclease [Candidatus Promineifilaceae bacterium]